MATDPGAPSYTVPLIAPATNFPAGANAWSSQPYKVAPILDYFVPGDVQPAEGMNFIFNARDVAQAAAKTYATNLRLWANSRKLVHQVNYGDSDSADALAVLASFTTTSYSGGTLASLSVVDTSYAPVAGDLIEIAFSGCYKITNGTGASLTSTIKLAQGITPTDIIGAKTVYKTSDANTPIVSSTIHGYYVHAGDTNVISILGKVSSITGSSKIELVGPFLLRAHAYKPV